MISELEVSNDLNIELVSEDVCLPVETEKYQGVIKKWVMVKNGKKYIRDCRVVLDALEFYFQDEWIPAPNGFERKAMKWDVAYECDGKIDFSVDGSEKLEVARLFRFPNPYFAISYHDGDVGKTQHFVGLYKLKLRVEGNVEGDGGLANEFVPTIFEVQLHYVSALELNIANVTKVNATYQ